MSPRTGRRAGNSGTRDDILNAARAAFTKNGYDAATIRDVARRAEVDPALVHHYFGTKRQLFIAAVDVPIDPSELIAAIVEGDRETIGLRIAQTFLQVWDAEANRNPIIALIRSATSNEEAAAMFREFISREIFGRVTAGLGVADPQLRAGLVGSQLMGVALLRYVVRLEPLASQSGDELADLLAPTLQRYLVGELPR